ncbi:hypothetical protein [Cedecea colo]|uniref:Uncharacterized protein n=1 Tax=Cedecea colo TaxID=2552946 RepID=A0ABX0VPZ8_9ENTR|nr:hypothetical protein [Cedecea colo]NIY48281.1 hypothetical protein [Cedecea colo]
MQNARVFKKRYILLILSAIVAFGIYKVLHFSPFEQEIIKKVKVNNLANLYVTEASAGATTGFSYRLYLYDASKDDKAFMASLEDDNEPFIITTDKDALKKVKNDAIYLSVKGTIYAFHNQAAYKVHDSIYSIPVYLTASPF